jgi:hypothetical protein
MAKQPRKVALINVHDYKDYSAYYEIRVIEAPEGEGFQWGVRVYARKQFDLVDGQRMCKVLHDVVDTAATRDEADTAAQTWVKKNMEQYKPKPKPEGGYSHVMGPLGLLGEAVAESLRRLLAGLLFALAYSNTVRNSRMTQVLNAIDGGAGAGLWRIYDGSRPATCGTATTLLAELTCSDPSGSVASQALTFSAITADASANATGTATWFRIVDSTGTCCVDGNVGTSGSDLNLNSVSISTGQEVSITSAVITEGNA